MFYTQQAHAMQIPIIKRFSGGGTVITDKDTLLVSLIANKSILPTPCFPSHIMQWSFDIYADVFNHPHFRLRENDYAFYNKKCGGNAQYFCKKRCLHHTSFLWDYQPSHLELLKNPKKQPSYRKQRQHEDFLCKIKDFWTSIYSFEEQFINTLSTLFDVSILNSQSLKAYVNNSSHRITTRYIQGPYQKSLCNRSSLRSHCSTPYYK